MEENDKDEACLHNEIKETLKTDEESKEMPEKTIEIPQSSQELKVKEYKNIIK